MSFGDSGSIWREEIMGQVSSKEEPEEGETRD